MFRWKRTAVVVAVAAITVSGCSSDPESSSEAGKPNRGGTATLLAIAPPGTLDPSGSTWGPLSAYYEAVYDTLLRIDAAGEYQPWLATDWTYNENRTELTLKLRDDVTFTDGSALTSQVVEQNLQRFKAGTAPNAAALAKVTSIETPDASTVVISLGQADPVLLTRLAQDAGLIASGEALDDPELATRPVGSGPYVLDTGATVIGSTYTYGKNPDYWNPDAQYFDKLVIKAAQDASSIGNAVRAGEVDVAQLPAPARAAADSADYTVHEVRSGGFAGLMLFDRGGKMSKPLADKRVRQAINHALDREALLKVNGDGNGSVTTQVFPVKGAAYDEALNEAYPHDPAKSKQLLADAGYPDGISLTLPDLGGRDRLVLLAQMLAEGGITVDWVESQLQTSITDILAPKYPAAWFSLGDATDWGTIQQIVSPTATFNPFRSQDPELTTLIETMRTGDAEDQAAAGRQINEYIVENAWFAPAFTAASLIASSPKVTVTPPTVTTFPSIYDIQPK